MFSFFQCRAFLFFSRYASSRPLPPFPSILLKKNIPKKYKVNKLLNTSSIFLILNNTITLSPNFPISSSCPFYLHYSCLYKGRINTCCPAIKNTFTYRPKNTILKSKKRETMQKVPVETNPKAGGNFSHAGSSDDRLQDLGLVASAWNHVRTIIDTLELSKSRLAWKFPPPQVNNCLICFDGAVSHTFVPCGHMVLCKTCADIYKRGNKVHTNKCPCCMGRYDDIIQVFNQP
jgi:hypothetical protein